MVVEEQDDNSSSILRTDYVRISDFEKPDTHPRGDASFPLNIESEDEPKKSVDIPEPDLLSSEDLQTPDLKLCQGSDLNPPTHPNISALMSIQQQSQETVHHFWARFLLVKNKIKDCRDEEAISVFRNNCKDKGILNIINHHRIL